MFVTSMVTTASVHSLQNFSNLSIITVISTTHIIENILLQQRSDTCIVTIYNLHSKNQYIEPSFVLKCINHICAGRGIHIYIIQ
jgi:acetoacetate decarboxylase